MACSSGCDDEAAGRMLVNIVVEVEERDKDIVITCLYGQVNARHRSNAKRHGSDVVASSIFHVKRKRQRMVVCCIIVSFYQSHHIVLTKIESSYSLHCS